MTMGCPSGGKTQSAAEERERGKGPQDKIREGEFWKGGLKLCTKT